ncbi:alpha-L-rhamnosidase [Paenibacillus sp. FSL H8-0548]|uniref:family 78 glycoside hydrolase catalytic domain n=1 Tax=Paenibacillus sp. FSL H8-0548 TaxID=1920422 RepID=UPI00096C60A6|nr:family 78 glycoside hydrolase catalytic domain [Paenibacillus sp. FSL H8-0548]OMF24110.1 alpha-L-rhamnosidase [Paenibacillus sp. FSL H8-0548]
MDKAWCAKWIMDQRFYGLKPIDVYHKEAVQAVLPEHKEELFNLHLLVRKSFDLNDHIEEAHLDITADDYYKLYVNGHFVGQGPAQGNHFHYFYNRFDIASYLRQGENVIAVQVYYHGLISRSYNSGDYRQGLIAELVADGTRLVQTDKTWNYRIAEEYGPAEVIGYNTQFQENIDSRLKEKGWRSAGYDDSDWLPSWENLADDHVLFLQPTMPLSVYEVKPQKIESIENGFLLDFGSELTGQFTMRAKGLPGQTVEIRCGEELLPSGRVRFKMRCNCTYTETWTLSGEEDELELYDYKAFRYVEVIASSNIMLYPACFAAIVRHYPLDEDACRFESSNTLLNSIWAICKNGVKYGTQENYVDCPSREKGQYLGDNTIITHSHAYVSGDLSMYRKSLNDFALLSARVCPGFMAVAPGSFMQEIADFSLQWPLQLLQYYKLSGDRAFLESMYPIAQQLMKHFEIYIREDGLLDSVNDKWNLVDWPENARDGYDFKLTKGSIQGCHNVINAFYYGALKAMSEIDKALNMAQSSDEGLERFRTAFIQAFYDSERKLFVDAESSGHSSLHANVLPLLFGLAPEESIKPIVQLIREKRLSCGVYMAYFVLKALAEAGEHELLYDLIVSEDLHSWGNMVKEGATTCFEAWSKDLKWNTSLCHPWASGPIPLLIEDIFGIKPAAPGWTEVRFSPRIPFSLSEIKLNFIMPAGEFCFEYTNGHAKLIAPAGVNVIYDS